MHRTVNSTGQRDASPESRPVRKGVLFGVVLSAGAILAVFIFRPPGNLPSPEQPGPVTPATEAATPPGARLAAIRHDFAPPVTAPAPPVEPAVQAGPPSPQQLVAQLAAINGTNSPVTSEQVKKFKQDFAELVERGTNSVPAIREFLEKNLEVGYAGVAGGDQLGYSSLRAALIDALKQIGGPEAQAGMLRALQTTAVPAEMLELAKNLDQEMPGLYAEPIRTAAQETLAMASASQLGTNQEVGPAFRMLQTFGAANTIADEAKNDPATFYNAISMANLPDGQGLPALLQMAQNPSGGSQTVATEMIAQLAGQNAQALDALLQMAQKGQIGNGLWMRLAPILGGDQYQLGSNAGQDPGADPNAAGNQNYSVVNNATTPDQINQRIATIDKFISLVTADSAAARALQHERDVLARKLGK